MDGESGESTERETDVVGSGKGRESCGRIRKRRVGVRETGMRLKKRKTVLLGFLS